MRRFLKVVMIIFLAWMRYGQICALQGGEDIHTTGA